MTAQESIEWLWNHCKIVYFPPNGDYPIEHNLAAHKNSRAPIEHAMNTGEKEYECSHLEVTHCETHIECAACGKILLP